MSYETDWIKVGVAGKTVDGRDIDEQWLLDAARLYSMDEYQAQLWTWSHYNKYQTYGVVTAVKAEKDNKKRLSLFVKVKPEPELVDLNRRGQLKYTSMEIIPNYKGQGSAYLTGLLFTNYPASTGLDQIEFSAGDHPDVRLSEPESFVGSLDNPQLDELAMPKWFKPFAKFFTSDQSRPDPIEEDVTMTPEQFEEFKALSAKQTEILEQNLAATKSLETKLESFSVKPESKVESDEADKKDEQSEVQTHQIPSKEEFAVMIGTAVENYMKQPDGKETKTDENTGAAGDWTYDY